MLELVPRSNAGKFEDDQVLSGFQLPVLHEELDDQHARPRYCLSEPLVSTNPLLDSDGFRDVKNHPSVHPSLAYVDGRGHGVWPGSSGASARTRHEIGIAVGNPSCYMSLPISKSLQ